ncbi:MAG TPA: hypothetical protein VKY62_08140 [Devosia sp.]|nr:hypothetical protein [Devosia sp.]
MVAAVTGMPTAVVSQIFKLAIRQQVTFGGQMNTNFDNLSVFCLLVHTGTNRNWPINAQKISKLLIAYAKFMRGLYWYCYCGGFVLTLVSKQP